jgi:hypothetical protein
MWRTLILLGTALAAGGDLPHRPPEIPRPPAPRAEAPPAPASPGLHFHRDVGKARQLAAATGKPLLVLNVLGDCHKHC